MKRGVMQSRHLFQSSPDPKAGCYVVTTDSRFCAICFNPHPTRRPGATRPIMAPAKNQRGFNPHPTRRPGATSPSTSSEALPARFNPHPTRRPGATYILLSFRSRWEFQSSPDPKAGCYFFKIGKFLSPAVSILTRPEGRVLRFQMLSIPQVLLFQSSPDPKAGCYAFQKALAECRNCFNPHPTRRPGATYND